MCVCIALGGKRRIPGSSSSSADLKVAAAFPETFLPLSFPLSTSIPSVNGRAEGPSEGCGPEHGAQLPACSAAVVPPVFHRRRMTSALGKSSGGQRRVHQLPALRAARSVLPWLRLNQTCKPNLLPAQQPLLVSGVATSMASDHLERRTT